ncbi:MAG: hypothetical protein OXQ89_13585 [Rhodospirillaceae bacterium]|nr:hypothetical protein [Rhodospirillaceae bacterium]
MTGLFQIVVLAAFMYFLAFAFDRTTNVMAQDFDGLPVDFLNSRTIIDAESQRMATSNGEVSVREVLEYISGNSIVECVWDETIEPVFRADCLIDGVRATVPISLTFDWNRGLNASTLVVREELIENAEIPFIRLMFMLPPE